jgi:hypothetical protein
MSRLNLFYWEIALSFLKLLKRNHKKCMLKKHEKLEATISTLVLKNSPLIIYFLVSTISKTNLH